MALKTDESWGERLMNKLLSLGVWSMLVLFSIMVLTVLFAWASGSPILDTTLKVLGITTLFLAIVALIALIEFLQRNDFDSGSQDS